MDKLTKEQIEMLRFFCLKLIPDFKKETYNMPYLNFVFTKKDLEYISFYLKSMKLRDNQARLDIHMHLKERNVDVSIIDEVLSILKKLEKIMRKKGMKIPFIFLSLMLKNFFHCLIV